MNNITPSHIIFGPHSPDVNFTKKQLKRLRCDCDFRDYDHTWLLIKSTIDEYIDTEDIKLLMFMEVLTCSLPFSTISNGKTDSTNQHLLYYVGNVMFGESRGGKRIYNQRFSELVFNALFAV